MPTIKTPMGEMQLPYEKFGNVATEQIKRTGVTPDMQDMNTNPFMAIFNGATGSGDMTQELPGQKVPVGDDQQKPNSMAVAQSRPDGEEIYDPRADQLTRGHNPSRSKALTTAITSLESFANDSTDQNELSLVRGLISAITRLMSKDQDSLRELL